MSYERLKKRLSEIEKKAKRRYFYGVKMTPPRKPKPRK